LRRLFASIGGLRFADPPYKSARCCPDDVMTVLTRILRDQHNPATEIPVRVFAPSQENTDWSCRFTIDWPDGELVRAAIGIDAIQAFELALRMIGTNLYTSDLHRSGRLMWLQPGQGYGFPVPNTLRDLLVGEDKLYL
jgi:hypothetical protein